MFPDYHKLDPHQEELFEAATELPYTDGVFISPTGSGKTFVIADTIYERASLDGGRVFVVLEPKIQLAMQQVKSIYNRLEATNRVNSESYPFRYMAVHSSKISSDYLVQYVRDREWSIADLPTHQFTSTTSSTEIAKEVQRAQESDQNIIIVSTYDSAKRIEQARIDVTHVFGDEAHHLVENDHHEVLGFFDAPYHHWTATPRYTGSDDGHGMNNTEKFGHVSGRITMERIVNEGVIAKPRLNLVHGMGTNESSIENKYSTVVTIADDQEDRIEYPPKIVFNCSGRDELHALAQAAAEDERFDDYLVAAISSEDSSSEDYGSWINGEKVNRSDWLDIVKMENNEEYDIVDDNTKKALVFHYDVVSEGIDVPGISATVLFRSIASKIKNLQILGRVQRLLKGERGVDFENRLKTYADIYIPIIEEPFDDGQDMNSQFETYKQLLYSLYSEEINIDPTEIRAVTQATGNSDEDDENGPLDMTCPEEISEILPEEVNDLADVHNEVYEDVQENMQETYINRMRANCDSVGDAIGFFEQDRNSSLSERERAELLLEHIYTQQNEGNYPSDHQITSSTYTPPELANNQIQKLDEAGAKFDGGDVLVLNPEYIVQIFRNGFRPNEITILCDDLPMKRVVRALGARFGFFINIVTHADQTDDMKFDVAVGNLPFQKNTGSSYAEAQWPDFLPKILNGVKKNGYVSLIHPSGWRTPYGEFEDEREMLMSRDMVYLNVNNREDGVSVFNATISYDWYVLKNQLTDQTQTTIEFVDGTAKKDIDITKLPMIPNKKLDEVVNILTTKNEESVEFIHDWSAYEAVPSRNEHVSHEKTDKYNNPIVYTITQGEGINLKWSSTDERGHFHIPKVIWSNGSSYPVVDEEGEYGLTQFAYGIADNPEVLPKIAEAMESDEFLEIMQAVKTVGHKYDRKVMSLLHKDFWKKFIDEE